MKSCVGSNEGKSVVLFSVVLVVLFAMHCSVHDDCFEREMIQLVRVLLILSSGFRRCLFKYVLVLLASSREIQIITYLLLLYAQFAETAGSVHRHGIGKDQGKENNH